MTSGSDTAGPVTISKLKTEPHPDSLNCDPCKPGGTAKVHVKGCLHIQFLILGHNGGGEKSDWVGADGTRAKSTSPFWDCSECGGRQDAVLRLD